MLIKTITLLILLRGGWGVCFNFITCQIMFEILFYLIYIFGDIDVNFVSFCDIYFWGKVLKDFRILGKLFEAFFVPGLRFG